MRRLTAILLALCVIGAAVALHAQNRIASGSTYHTIEPRNVMPYSIWTNCVMWLTCDQNPSNNATWTVQSFGSEAAKNNGTNDVASKRPAWVSGTLAFDASDDYVVAADAASLSPTAAITVAFWAKVATSANQYFVFKRIGFQNLASYGFNSLATSNLQFSVSSDGANSTNARTAGRMPIGAWTHLVGVFNAGTTLALYTNAVNGTASLYTDAGLPGQSVPAALYDSSAYLVIGAINNPPVAPINGSVSDVAIFNRALTATEITNLYNATKSPTPARP
jgi:hypothetical protein